MATYNTKSYVQGKVEPNKVTLVGPSHTFTSKQTLALARTDPKPSGAFKGVSRAEVKGTRTAVVNPTTGESRDIIIYAGASIPVGADATTLDDVIADTRAFVASADFVTLIKTGKINVV